MCLEYVAQASEMRFNVERDGNVLRLAGTFEMRDAGAIWRALDEATREAPPKLTFDLSHVERIDGGAMALVAARRADLDARIGEVPEDVAPLVKLYQADAAKSEKAKKRKPESAVAQVGRVTLDIVEEVKGVLSFVGEMTLAAFAILRHPRKGHWKEIPPLVEKAGADAVPIVLLINFLVGFVTAYQAANQLKTFGANIYVADLVVLSVTRELAPLMTAIIVCGRSGAAYAAEIGSMKINEEIDALRTLGLQPFAWLVVPRVLALVIITPLLVLIADLVGSLGGMVVAATSLDITPYGYLAEVQKAVVFWDVEHGLIKSVAFALAIGLIACQQGFSATGGAEGVGRRTTSTVVISLFALVVLDAAFTVIFRVLGR